MYIKIIKNKSTNQSLFSRQKLSEIIREKYGFNKYYPNFDIDGKPIFENNIYWSISHKKGILLLGINNNKIGVDIEINKKRSNNFLDIFLDKEYSILGGKTWENFYFLWTSKESIIKYNLGSIDDMRDISLINEEKINEGIDGIHFQKRLIFSFQDNTYFVLSGKKEDFIYSVCV